MGIHNSDRPNGRCRVKMDVYFTAAGTINIPTKQELERLRADYQKNKHSA